MNLSCIAAIGGMAVGAWRSDASLVVDRCCRYPDFDRLPPTPTRQARYPLTVTTFQRPAPDLQKIAEAWRVWTEGSEGSDDGEDVLPGRSMADLKIGGTDKVLETLAAESEAISPVFDIWMAWEKGKSTPEVALAGLEDNGFAAIVEALHDSE